MLQLLPVLLATLLVGVHETVGCLHVNIKDFLIPTLAFLRQCATMDRSLVDVVCIRGSQVICDASRTLCKAELRGDSVSYLVFPARSFVHFLACKLVTDSIA